MTEKEIISWMQDKVKKDGFTDAASLAKNFLSMHNINDSLNPDFSRTMDASFKVAKEVYSL
jgi:hypothetical protein